ncbi:MAG: hypothetical protein DRO92_02580 [Candidatus Altiarchaeales archaeon]|nr:MAG: hypothetical protein DRO92_02580 [Candidatus Altiarchaeales archaeon]
MELIDINILLRILTILVLIICLYIIRDNIFYIKKSVSRHSTSAILYLKSDRVIKGLKILMVAIIIWSIKEIIGFIKDYMSLSDIFQSIGGFYGSIYSILGLFIAISLSYGLYIISDSFRTHLE